MDSKLYTVNQIAKMFDMHPKTIRRYIQKGSLAARKIGKEWRVLETDLIAFLDSNVEFRGKHRENTMEAINDFINVENIEAPGTVNILTIADVYVKTSDDVQNLCDRLIEVIKSVENEPKAQF